MDQLLEAPVKRRLRISQRPRGDTEERQRLFVTHLEHLLRESETERERRFVRQLYSWFRRSQKNNK